MTAPPASAASGPRATAPERLTFDHGLLLRGAHLVGLVPGRGGLVRVGVVLAVVTWLPLVLLAAIDSGGPAPTMGLRESIATHVRLLVALPALFLAESLFSTRIHSVIGEMLQKGIIPEADEPRFIRNWRRTQRLWGSWEVEAGPRRPDPGVDLRGSRSSPGDAARPGDGAGDHHVARHG